MIETVKERLSELRKNGNVVNVLYNAPTTTTLTGVTVEKVREDYVVFFKASTNSNTAITFKQIKDVVY